MRNRDLLVSCDPIVRFAEGPLAVQLRAGARPSVASQRSGRARLPRLAVSATGLLLVASPVVLGSASPGAASNIQTLQSTAQALAVRVDTLDTRLAILSEQYDQARARANLLDHEVAAAASQLGSAEKQVRSDTSSVRSQAIYAYVTAGSGEASVDLSAAASSLPAQQTYLQAASGNLTTSVSSLQNSEHRLSVQRSTLQRVDAEAKANAATIAAAQQSAQGLEQQVSSTLAGVKGELASAVAQQEAQQQAAAERAVASQAARAAALDASSPAPAAAAPPAQPTVVGSGDVGAVLTAARSVFGSPYSWGGASPGGFDCSGLAMWAWSHAGVSLPHSAEAQYESTPHVSLDALQPGDLVFYASGGYIYHVVIYAGGGQAIQAETYGTVVQYTPLPGGAFAAGRP